MKTFEQLNKDQKRKAIEHAFQELVAVMVEGFIELSPNVESRLKETLIQSEANNTNPYSDVSSKMGDYLLPMAEAAAETALYQEEGDMVIRGIAEEEVPKVFYI